MGSVFFGGRDEHIHGNILWFTVSSIERVLRDGPPPQA